MFLCSTEYLLPKIVFLHFSVTWVVEGCNLAYIIVVDDETAYCSVFYINYAEVHNYIYSAKNNSFLCNTMFFVKTTGTFQFCIKSSNLLPQFLGFFCFPCEKPHT